MRVNLLATIAIHTHHNALVEKEYSSMNDALSREDKFP